MRPDDHDPRIPSTPEQRADSHLLAQEALVRVLVRKGLITERELLDELQAVKGEKAGGRESEAEADAYSRHFGVTELDKQF